MKVTRFHEGFTFLGFDIKSRFVRMRARSVENFKTKVRRITRRSHNLDAEMIEQLENELATLKDRRQSTPKHLAWDDLPQEQKFERLVPSRKRLTDTVKLVAYRAETAMALIVREQLSHVDEARCLIRDLCRSDADIRPDEAAGLL